MSQRRNFEDEFDDEDGEPPQGVGHRHRTMRDYLHWIMRRLWVVVLTTVVGVVLGLYVFKRTPPTYESRATIQIERQEVGERLDENDQEVRLTGVTFINTVAKKFSLPKFYKVLAEDHALHERPDILPKEFAFFSEKEANPGAAVPGLTPDELADMMPLWVKAVAVKDSNLLDIVVKHTSPEISEIVANGVIEAYQKVSAKERMDQSVTTVDRVGKEMTDLRDKVSKLSKRKARYAECQQTKELIDETELKIAQMSTRYGPKWVPFIEVKDLLSSLEEKFRRELEAVKSGDDEEKSYWEAPERAGTDPIDELQPRVTLLENEMQTAELRLATMQSTQTLAQLDAREENEENEFSVQRAAQLGLRVGPSPVLLVATFTLGGIGIGVGLVLLLGFLDSSARTISDLEGQFDLPILGAIPADKNQRLARKGKARTIAKILVDHSAPAEAVRNLRAGLSFLGTRKERRSFLFTSSLPGEGKSWVSANLAVAFGAQDDTTVIIDLDLRKPTQHKIFGVERTPGVTDFLTQEVPLKEVFRRTEHKNVYLITAGTQSPNPSELLTLRNLRRLMESIPESIDRIVIDTSPVLAVRDALAPAKLVDSTIVVFKMASTPVKALDRLLKVMDENHTLPVGIVANVMPNSRRKGYGYNGDYHYAYHGYGEYYGEDSEDNGQSQKKSKKRKNKTTASSSKGAVTSEAAQGASPWDGLPTVEVPTVDVPAVEVPAVEVPVVEVPVVEVPVRSKYSDDGTGL